MLVHLDKLIYPRAPGCLIPKYLFSQIKELCMQEKFLQLKARLLEVDNLEKANAVLQWDQATYMPPGGAEARGGI